MNDSLFDDSVGCGCGNKFCRTCNPPRNGQAAVDFAADWRLKADKWFDRLPSGSSFTSEDVTLAVGYPAGETGMNRNNAVGGWIQRLANTGRLWRVGDRASRNPQAHGAMIGIWRKSW